MPSIDRGNAYAILFKRHVAKPRNGSQETRSHDDGHPESMKRTTVGSTESRMAQAGARSNHQPSLELATDADSTTDVAVRIRAPNRAVLAA